LDEDLKRNTKKKDYSVRERRENTVLLLEVMTYYYVISSLNKYMLDLENMNSGKL